MRAKRMVKQREHEARADPDTSESGGNSLTNYRSRQRRQQPRRHAGGKGGQSPDHIRIMFGVAACLRISEKGAPNCSLQAPKVVSWNRMSSEPFCSESSRG